jgi:CheY-like chemotaxis protein
VFPVAAVDGYILNGSRNSMADQLLRVLLIDDNAVDVLLFREVLRSTGLNIETRVVSDGDEALKIINDEVDVPVPNLVILDLFMPKADGKTVLQAMRRNSRFSDVPVVVSSSVNSPRHQATLGGLKIRDYLIKPPNLQEFLALGDRLKRVLLTETE